MIKALKSLFYKTNEKNLATNYFLVQVIIWLKCIWYYSLFGFGKVLEHTKNFFPEWATNFDLIFHHIAHVVIGILAIAYGYKTKKMKLENILPTIFLAVLLHNLFYYLTNSHPSIIYSIVDFGVDSTLLLSFIYIGYLASKL